MTLNKTDTIGGLAGAKVGSSDSPATPPQSYGGAGYEKFNALRAFFCHR
ncbi:MAG: hypothetical protein K2K47_08725 [Duncaniella sp.]|nr:hypothetical protein [Duncaniella sp.]